MRAKRRTGPRWWGAGLCAIGLAAPGSTPASARGDAPTARGTNQHAIDYELPRRIVCRTGDDLRVVAEQRALVLHGATILAGRVVKSHRELPKGSCAGLLTPDNDVGTAEKPRYGVFGPKVQGPLAAELRNYLHVEVSGGKVRKLYVGGSDHTSPFAPDRAEAPFPDFVEWFRASDGGFEASVALRPAHAPGEVRIELGQSFRVVDVVKQAWSAPAYPVPPKPAAGAEPSSQDRTVPRRIHCRATTPLSFRRLGPSVEVPVVPVAGRVVRGPGELKPGECAGARVSDNEDGAGGYRAFGAGVTGPLLARWSATRGSEVGVWELGIAKDGRLSSLRHSHEDSFRPAPNHATAVMLRDLGAWVQGRPGGLDAAAERDPNLPDGTHFRLPLSYLRTQELR